MKNRHIVTDEDFELFTKKVHEFADKSGLYEWRILTKRQHLKDNTDGEFSKNFNQMSCVTFISDTLHELTTVEYVAAHEVAECMIAQMRFMAARTYNEDMVDEYSHELINHIVRLLLRG